jgi:hypothetical protein
VADESVVYTALTSGSPSLGSPVYAIITPQGAVAPYVIYSLISAVPLDNLEGRPGMDNRRVQIDCYALTLKAAKTLFYACRERLESIAHLSSEGFVNYESDTKLFRASGDFSLWLSR